MTLNRTGSRRNDVWRGAARSRQLPRLLRVRYLRAILERGRAFFSLINSGARNVYNAGRN